MSETSAKIEPFFNRGGATLYLGNSLRVLGTLPDESVDSVVTDPPYGIRFMGKKWDISVPSQEVWEECLRVLKPGGHLLAFAGTRTQHRMASRIEDAGFEIRDMIAWVYSSGFPKSMDISKAVSKENVADSIAEPNAGAAKQWQGWGTALKPALEPITVARKPFPGTVASNVLSYGTGALNIDSCRVPTGDKLGGGRLSGPTSMANTCGGSEWDRPWMNDESRRQEYASRTAEKVAVAESLGRWPANLIHDGSEDVMVGFPFTSSGAMKRDVSAYEGESVTGFLRGRSGPKNQHGDSGSASRFFYCAKASKQERGEGNKHPTVKPLALMVYLCRLVTPPGGIVLDNYVGSGTTGKAAVSLGFRFIGIDDDPESLGTAARRIGEEIDSMSMLAYGEASDKAAS